MQLFKKMLPRGAGAYIVEEVEERHVEDRLQEDMGPLQRTQAVCRVSHWGALSGIMHTIILRTWSSKRHTGQTFYLTRSSLTVLSVSLASVRGSQE
jgi:hypothetical protein